MLKTRILPVLAALVLTAIGTTATANVISLAPAGQSATIGDTVSFDVNIDFINTTVGGAFDVFYDDSILSFSSFEFDLGFLGPVADPAFTFLPDDSVSGVLNGIAFGSFDGISGQHLIGTLTFETIDAGVAVLGMDTNVAPWGGFFSADDASELVVVYGPGKVHVVPIPAAAWLFASGLGLLAGVARRKRA